MKRFLSIFALGMLATAAFTGCDTLLQVEGPDPHGHWNSVAGILTVKYPQSTLESAFEAASKGLDSLGYYRTGENRPRDADKEKIYVVYARAIGDVKITVKIYTATDIKAGTEWVQADIGYGAWGNLEESQKIQAAIAKYL